MAASPVVAAVTESAVTTAGTSHAVTLPGSGAATDLYLIIMSIGSTAATMNALTDWTELLDENAAIGLKIWIYTGTGVPANPTFTSSGSTRSATLAYRITGADKAVTPQIGTTSTGTSLTPDPPSVTPTGGISKPYLFITFAGMAGEEADDDTWGNTPPTNYTPNPPRQKACGTVGTNLGGLILSAERALTTGSAEDPGTFNVDVSAAWRAQTIIVHPLFSGTASASNTTPRATATGAKNFESTATASNTTPRATATGSGSHPNEKSGSATCSSTPRATATGSKSGWATSGASRTVIEDAFNDGTLDGKWTTVSAGVTETGGQASIPFTNSTTVSLATATVFDPKEKSVTFELVQGDTAVGSYTANLELADNTGNNLMGWRLAAGILSPKYRVGGASDDPGSLVYNSTTHRWVRVRETYGWILWETSPDGVVWTLRASRQRTTAWTHSARVRFYTNSTTGTPPANFLVDNFSLVDTTGATASAAARATSTGQKKATGTATSSAAARVTASGEGSVVIVSGTASMSNTTPRATSTGAKGGTSAAAESAKPTATSTGAKGGTGDAAASNTTPRATSTGQKNAAGSAAASNTTPRAASSGAKGGQSTASASESAEANSSGQKVGQASASASARATATSTGARSASGSASASVRASSTSSGAKGGQSDSTASARAAVSSSGAKAASGAAAASASAAATSSGQKATSSTASASVVVTVTAIGTSLVIERHSGSSSMSAAAAAAAAGFKGGRSAASASVSAELATSGTKAVASSASVSARGTTTAAGLRAASGAATATVQASATSSGAKNSTGSAEISAAVLVRAQGPGISLSGSASVSARVTVTSSGFKLGAVVFGGRVAIADNGRVRGVRSDPPVPVRGRVD